MNFKKLEDSDAIAQAEDIIAEALEAETFGYRKKHILTRKGLGDAMCLFIYDRESDEYFTGNCTLVDQALQFIDRRANF